MRSCYIRRVRCVVVLALFALGIQTAYGGDFSQAEASEFLRRAVAFYRTKVGVRGGYGYAISNDLSKREGENRTSNTQAWVEPPATPAVGMAYLQAYQLTGEQYLLEAALETANCLVDTQLVSGGWQNPIETDSVEKLSHPYRKNPPQNSKLKIKQELTTLDDNKTQSCLTFLIRLDVETKFQQIAIHEAVLYGLDALIQAQYPNGAWPQQFAGPSQSKASDTKKASYPETWSWSYPAVKYTEFYTFNDDTIADATTLMLEASISYGDDRYVNSA